MHLTPGSESARRVRRLLEAWIASDHVAVSDELDVIEDANELLRWLVLIVGGVIMSMAEEEGSTYEEFLPMVWARLASVTGDDLGAELMRTLVTTWTLGDDNKMADFINEAGLAAAVPFDQLVMHFLGAAKMLATLFTESIGEPFTYATDAWWPLLEGD
jgi:hypothetical protein